MGMATSGAAFALGRPKVAPGGLGAIFLQRPQGQDSQGLYSNRGLEGQIRKVLPFLRRHRGRGLKGQIRKGEGATQKRGVGLAGRLESAITIAASAEEMRRW